MFRLLHPCFFSEPLDWARIEQHNNYIIPMTSHPCRIQVLAIGALVVKRIFVRTELPSSVQIEVVAEIACVALNESNVAQMRAELWPET